MIDWADIMVDKAALIRLQQTDPIPLDIDIGCHPGEIFVLVGASGSGKTTTLRSIAGLYRPANGRIECNGKLWYDTATGIDLTVQKRAAGLVFQHYALFPHLTVRDNILIACTNTGKLDREKRLAELIGLTHLSGLEKRYPHQLSGGQQQRVAFARALARSPDILLLDEPFSAIDQQTRRHLVRELVQLKSRINVPIIHVTHNLNEARRIADRICIIDQGRSLQTDTPEAIMSSPGSAVVARLTGQDNVYRGVVCHQDAALAITRINWHGQVLQTAYSPEFRLHETVDWVIPASQIVIHAALPANDNGRNLFTGTISEIIQLGEGTIVTVALPGISDTLTMNLSTYTVRQDRLVAGNSITLGLLTGGIHLMKTDIHNSSESAT